MRNITAVYSPPPPHWVGDGFPVRALFSHAAFGEHVSPFLMLDYAGPQKFAPSARPRGVGLHPHRGFETVTIVYDGEVEHLDSTGAGGSIGPGDVQWMTAAAGILHEEFHSQTFTEKGGMLEMVQLWVNLPARDKMAAPGYQSILAKDIPAIALPEGAGLVRVIAGAFGGHKGPAKTFTPIDVWDVRLAGGHSTALTLPQGHTLIVAVLTGAVLINGTQAARDGETVLFDRKGGAITIEAESDVKLLVLSGEPLGEPIVAHGPFVMNTAEEIAQAFADFRNGQFGRVLA